MAIARRARIADGCGIPLDQFTDDASAAWREQLGVNAYPSAVNAYGAEAAAANPA